MIVFLLMFSSLLYAQEKSPEINVITYPGTPVAGQSWTLTLLVDYPDPDEVFVSPPNSEALSLDRILKTPRVTGDKVQTVIEYRFTPKKSGRFILEKFTVVCPGGSVQTEPIILNIQANTEEKVTNSFQLDWEIDSPVRTGERTILTLRSRDSQLPPPSFFLPQTPPGLILSLMPLPEQERKTGIAAKFIIIPLETRDYFFEARSLQYENINFIIPALKINAGNTSKINSQELINSETVSDLENNINFIEIVDSSAGFSDDSANKRILQRRFFFSFSMLIIILVIITPLVCLFLFVRKK